MSLSFFLFFTHFLCPSLSFFLSFSFHSLSLSPSPYQTPTRLNKEYLQTAITDFQAYHSNVLIMIKCSWLPAPKTGHRSVDRGQSYSSKKHSFWSPVSMLSLNRSRCVLSGVSSRGWGRLSPPPSLFDWPGKRKSKSCPRTVSFFFYFCLRKSVNGKRITGDYLCCNVKRQK